MSRRRTDFDEVLRKAKSWAQADQAELVERLLTPRLRLRLLVEQVRGSVQPRDERKIDQVVNRAVRRVRRAKIAAR